MMDPGNKRFVVLLLVGLVVRLAVAWQPVPVLIARVLPDDAFIYFVIARNMAAGLGATFDGLAPTNGFHPLWALALTPVFALWHGGDTPVHWALTLGALCDTAAGGLAGWIVWRGVTGRGRSDVCPEGATTRVAPTVAMTLYLFNPRVIQESVNGLETGLAMLALAGCVAAWQWAGERPGAGRDALFGLACGLAVLARSDLGLMAAVLWLARVWAGIRGGGRTLAVTHWLAPVAALAVVAPWWAWSQWRVGTVVQSSAVAIPSLVAYRVQTSAGGEAWRGLLWPILNLGFRDTMIYAGVGLLALCVGVLVARLVRAPLYRGELWLPLLGALIIAAVHTAVRWYPRGWYFVPVAWGVALAAAPVWVAGPATKVPRRLAGGIAMALAVIVGAQSVKMIGEPEYAWQADMRAGAEWLRANTAPEATVGAFNAGIYSYYSGRRVLSLDGLVDWGAIAVRREGRLLDYFVERGGSLLLDHREYLWGSFSPFFGSRKLELIAELPVADKRYGPIVVYRVH